MGCIVIPATTPHSYIVEVPSDQIRRNRSDLNQRAEDYSQPTTTPPIDRPTTRSQTGAPLQPPDHLTNWRKGDDA